MKKIKKDWELFEEDIAEYFDGSRQRGSGNGPIQKGDIRTEDLLIECKYTSKDNYFLSWKTWQKIVDEARNLMLIPLFACRSNAGDFLVGNEIDFELNDNNLDTEDGNRIKIDRTKKIIMHCEQCDYHLICWELNLEDY